MGGLAIIIVLICCKQEQRWIALVGILTLLFIEKSILHQ
jgi:hypothetical protein